jgi:FkbM family methyltransferase
MAVRSSALVRELKTFAKMAANHRGQREVLLREYFFRAAGRFTPEIATEADGLRFYVATDDDVIGRVTFMYRGFDESAMRRTIAMLAARTGVAEPLRGRTILDVGANIGTTSVYALRTFGAARSVAFEPAPGNLRLLRQNLFANGVGDAVRVLEVALSDRDGEVEFELSEENSGDHRVRAAAGGGVPGGELFAESGRAVIRVPARRLDALVEEGAIHLGDVGIVWIDVQGHEAHVLEGARRVLDARIPVAVEYWPYGLGRAGGLERFHALVAERFATVVDMGHPDREAPPRVLEAGAVAELAGRYAGANGMADLLLLP